MGLGLGIGLGLGFRYTLSPNLPGLSDGALRSLLGEARLEGLHLREAPRRLLGLRLCTLDLVRVRVRVRVRG